MRSMYVSELCNYGHKTRNSKFIRIAMIIESIITLTVVTKSCISLPSSNIMFPDDARASSAGGEGVVTSDVKPICD